MLHRAMVALKEEVRVGDVVDMALKVAKNREPT